MTQDDVLFGYRLQLFDLAARTSVTEACRTFGIHRSTYYVWKRKVERHGAEILRPRERRRPRMPNQLSPMIEERIVAFALGHPGFGPRRIASELRRKRWGGLVVSHNGVWRCLKRHGLPDESAALRPGRRLRRPVRAAAGTTARAARGGGSPRRRSLRRGAPVVIVVNDRRNPYPADPRARRAAPRAAHSPACEQANGEALRRVLRGSSDRQTLTRHEVCTRA
jgi:transposase